MRMRRYIIGAGGRSFELPPNDVIPWLRGYLAHRCEDDPDLTNDLSRQIARLPGESLQQSCYRVLMTCHDHGVVDYQGIHQE